MIVELLSVGTEILLGDIVNTNAAFLSRECANLGLCCYYQSVVGDNCERLKNSLELALKRADIVILSGGLGPTPDDLTKEVAASVFEQKLTLHKPSKENIIAYFKSRNKEISENNWKQAMIPEGAIVLSNENGTAPGVIMEKGEKRIILLPGPPNELIPMFKEKVVPYLRSLSSDYLVSKVVKIYGIGEGMVASRIQDLIDNQTNPTIATYAKTGEVHLRITALCHGEEEGDELIAPMLQVLYDRFGDAIFTISEEETLEDVLVSLLKEKNMTITTAESCTGGMLASKIIDVSGASSVMKEGFITYANEAKETYAFVSKETLDTFGAVSYQVAKEMAEGVAKRTGANVAVSVTGIAGPDGGTEEKPVGLVYIGCHVNGKTDYVECHFAGNRLKIRENSVKAALFLARKCILNWYNK